MSASSDGLTDDIYSEDCDFSYLGGGCGISHHYSSTPNTLFKVYECTKPTTIHLKRLNSSESCDFPEGLLILYRTGIFSIDATTTQLSICPKHRDFYGIHWKNKSARCQHPDHPSSSKAKADRGSSPLLCKQNWLYTRQIIPVGTGLCKQCSIKMKNFVKSDKTQVKLNIEEDVELFERLCGHISSIHEDKEDTDLDLDSQLSFLSTTTLTELSQQSTSDWEADNASGRDKFNRAMNILGNGKFPTLKHQLKLPWDDVSKSTKAMYLKFTSDVVNLIIQYIAPGQENKIMADLSEKYMYLNDDNQTTHDDMTKALIQAYLDQNNSQTQIQILSLFVQKFTKQKLIELIPGLTMSKIDRARKHANLEKPGQMINSPRIYRMRLSHPQLMHFIEFISSPSYHQAVGYGSKTLQLSSGVEMKIPKVVRSIISSRLIKTYMAYCKDQDYDTFSRSTLYNILNVCIASQKKNLHGLDNTTADGMKAMDTLTDIIKKLQLFGLEEKKVEKLKNIFASANQHLKFEIKGHLATSSTCLDHCTTFSLSDSKSTQFRSTCAHEHSEGCTKCSIIDKSLLELSNTFQTMNSIPAEIVDEIDHDLSRAQEQIMTWKAHCVRTVHQDQAKQTVLGNLKPHQALIVMDWAMKFLPVRHREAQSDFFGKKGVSWHVSSVVTLDIEAEPEFKTNFNVHTLVHILELGNQGWFSVAHIITDLLQKLPLILPLVTEIFLKSDNAGCYHCVPLISYIQNINVNGGLPVKILQYNFSEAQSGKDICDAKTSHCKMHILRYSGEGHDVLSAEDMSTALNSNGGVKGVFNAVVAIDQNHQTKTKTKIPNISAMNNFEFYSEGVKVRRAYGIGNGNFIPNLQFKDNKLMEGFQVIIPFSNFVADHHGRVVLARNNIDVEHENMGNDNDTENNGNENVTETVENEMEEDVSNDGLFACPDQSCTKVFTKPHFLEAHIVIGNHVYSTSENSYDSVKLIWAQQCEAVDREHKVLIQSVSSINMNVNEGWALKLNKPFKRFTKKVKDFLFDIYVKCESSGKRPNFDTLATELKTTRHENDGTKMFTREEWLSSSQIRSLFANFVRLGAETSLKSEDTAVIENVLEEIDSLEYHNNMTELATDVVQQFL